MQKSYLFIGLFVVGLVAAAFFFGRHLEGGRRLRTAAVLVASGSPLTEAVYNGIVRTFEKSARGRQVRVVPYWVVGADKVQTGLMCEALLTAKPDVILSVGIVCTRALVEVMRRRCSAIPSVYVGVPNELALEFIDSLERPGGNITGVMADHINAETSARLILAVKPNVQKILIPYEMGFNVGGYAEALITTIRQYLEPRGVLVDVLPLNGLSDALVRVKARLSGHDMIFGLEGEPAVGQLCAGFARLCDEEGVTFFVSTYEGVSVGAAITYAINPKFTSSAAVTQGLRILFGRKKPATMPIIQLDSTRELFINPVAASTQGCPLDPSDVINQIEIDPALAALRGRVLVKE
ncbi:MAG: putative tryptophan/tyrosine transport system substrate-binding protein [Candidatus Dependentiae bacterium]|nr:putative tryptophan/tyrosine transport system substrate-binding protein [Candidatus Dependentiae bacterium]